MTENRKTNSSESARLTRGKKFRDTLEEFIINMMNEIDRKDRSLRQRRAYRSKALSKGGE